MRRPVFMTAAIFMACGISQLGSSAEPTPQSVAIDLRLRVAATQFDLAPDPDAATSSRTVRGLRRLWGR